MLWLVRRTDDLHRNLAARRGTQVEEEVASHNRLARHLFVIGTTGTPGKEVRLQRLGPTLTDVGLRRGDSGTGRRSRTQLGTAAWGSLAWAVFGLAYVGVIVFVAIRLDAHGRHESCWSSRPGAASRATSAPPSASSASSAASGSTRRASSVGSSCFREAADEQADSRAPTASRTDHYRELSFAYPGTDKLVLEDISLDAARRQGGGHRRRERRRQDDAGQAALSALQADQGRILVDGTDLQRIGRPIGELDYRRAFQDFFRFEFSAQAAVGLGDTPRIDDRPPSSDAVDRAGADDVVDRLARGLDTQLGPTWDEGVEVSHGQWQKLALARGFMRDEPLVQILDEPTSALDAETEHGLFERYANSAREGEEQGRITILVSHRFSTVRMADLIIVLDGSRLAEFGSHDDLIRADGPYAELYNIQAASYR